MTPKPISTPRPHAPVRWIWRHIELSLPADWEMLQFSGEFNRGRCAFADRRQFRVELSWSAVRGEPDYDRMISDYMERMNREKKMTGGTMVRSGDWHGFYGAAGNTVTSRFGRYLAPIGCLVELVFLWPEEREPEREYTILRSAGACTSDPDGHQVWRAFGLEIHVPATTAFEGCTAQPARTEFTFTNPKTQNTWHFSRLGMVPSWFNGNLESWLRGTLAFPVRDLRITHRNHHGADLLMAEGMFKPQRLHLRQGKLEAAVWICPADGRLYAVKKWGRRPEPGGEVPIERMLIPAPEFTPQIKA
jgi:hypothetical protein